MHMQWPTFIDSSTCMHQRSLEYGPRSSIPARKHIRDKGLQRPPLEQPRSLESAAHVHRFHQESTFATNRAPTFIGVWPTFVDSVKKAHSRQRSPLEHHCSLEPGPRSSIPSRKPHSQQRCHCSATVHWAWHPQCTPCIVRLSIPSVAGTLQL